MYIENKKEKGDSMGTLTIMVGLPGSGKDTLIRKQYKDAVVLSSDELRVELYGYEDQTHNAEVFAEMNRRAKETGRAGSHVIYNATNLNRGRRVGLCNDMKKYFDAIEVVVCICPIDVLLKRNIERAERHLPEDKLRQMIKSIQLPVQYEYPYSKISYVSTGDSEHLEIERLESLKTYEQHNKYHSEPLGIHIERVANACQSNANAYIAAKYHDLGKPFCKTIDEEGYFHFIGHPNVSAYMYMSDLVSHDMTLYNNDLDIMFLIESHDYIFSFGLDFEKMKKKMSNKYNGLSEEFWDALKMLTDADRLRP